FFYVTTRPPPRSPLFPYTTLFRSLSVHTSSYQAAGRLGMRVATAELAMRHARKIPRRLLVEGLRALYDADSALKAGSTNDRAVRSEEHTSELQSLAYLVCRLLLEK